MVRLKPQYRTPALLLGSTLLVVALSTFYLVTTVAPSKVTLPATVTQLQLPPAALPTPAATIPANTQVPVATIRARLHHYLRQVTTTTDTSVTFYNLTPVPGSTAAKRTDPLNVAGSVATVAQGSQARLAGASAHLALAAYLSHLQATGEKIWTASDSAGMHMMLANNGPYYANTILTRYGKGTVNHYLKKLDLTPAFSDVTEDHTTTNDLANLLRKLADHQAPFAHQRMQQRVLQDLAAQVERRGIPAGVTQLLPKAKIQNVTGQLGNSTSDAATVTLPDGQRFVLAIMTTTPAADFTQIQAIAKEVTHLAYFRG
ncbi:MAG: serine hydrolase [Lactobacillus sp.]|jgi:beta-lactamase class A|nr:serine hydrolase [Lactobacillus sp.]MCI2033242.1 serine hydrolase [Lactobacillus sp.]